MKKFRTFCAQQLSENLSPELITQVAQTAIQLEQQLQQIAAIKELPDEYKIDAKKVAEQSEALVKNLQAFYSRMGIE